MVAHGAGQIPDGLALEGPFGDRLGELRLRGDQRVVRRDGARVILPSGQGARSVQDVLLAGAGRLVERIGAPARLLGQARRTGEAAQNENREDQRPHVTPS